MKWFEKAILASAVVAASSGALAAVGTESFDAVAGTKHFGTFGPDADGTVKAVTVKASSPTLQAFLNGTQLTLQGVSVIPLTGLSLFTFQLAGYTTNAYSFDIGATAGTAYSAILDWDSDQSPTLGSPITAIPEPGTMGMVLAGAGIIAFMSRRRRMN